MRNSGWQGDWGFPDPFGAGGRPGGRRSSGPPPWLTGLFGLTQTPPSRGPKVRRGDVRAAILDVLDDEPRNGYQIITEITERSGGAWKPSPGSVYPTLQQLEDEGLVETIEDAGRKASRLTRAGQHYVDTNRDELSAVWAPFADAGTESGTDPAGDYASLKPEIGQVMNAAWQIITTGTDHQRREAIKVLIEARKGLYGILAEGDSPDDNTDDNTEDSTDDTTEEPDVIEGAE